MNAPFASDQDFEEEVRRIARARWPSAAAIPSPVIDGQERDGIFITEDVIFIVESTTSRKKEKAEHDVKKIAGIINKYGNRHPHKLFKGYFVTLDPPTADQIASIRKANLRIEAISYKQFRDGLIKGTTYLDVRQNYPFGSARDPRTNSPKVDFQYVPLDLVTDKGSLISFGDLAESLSTGEKYVLLGDYGSGKSMTLRELFLNQLNAYHKSQTSKFPLYINLRDHQGQTDTSEAIERHGRKIGFPDNHKLVQAWHAGFCILLLDGFDELAGTSIMGQMKRLSDLRYRSMELVRGFIRESPPDCGVIVAGRSHYFDTISEMRSGLGLQNSAQVLQLGEFNDEQIQKYLASLGFTEALPSWVPARPLFLGHLAVCGGLAKLAHNTDLLDQASGWDYLLDCICHREAELETGADSDSIRRIIEELAVIGQRSLDGLGPFSSTDLDSAFQRACGYPPSDRDKILLMRISGLGPADNDTGHRYFVDSDLAEAALGSAMASFFDTPFGKDWHRDNFQGTIKPLGARVAAAMLRKKRLSPGKIDGALEFSKKHYAQTPVIANLLFIAARIENYPLPSAHIDGQLIDHLEISTDSFHIRELAFRGCLMSLLDIDPDFPDKSLPSFDSCSIGTLKGRGKAWVESSKIFANCEIEKIDEEEGITTALIMNLNLPPYSKVVISILKKVYAQSGSARKENALYRGLSQFAQQDVPRAIDNLKSDGFIIRLSMSAEPLWAASKNKTIRSRVRLILGSPNSSKDPILFD
jgi:hypothetical protein